MVNGYNIFVWNQPYDQTDSEDDVITEKKFAEVIIHILG